MYKQISGRLLAMAVGRWPALAHDFPARQAIPCEARQGGASH